tara:strand:- start:2 stop:223 length:222 start_codon:yes stop_codon:yes gene_type:complete
MPKMISARLRPRTGLPRAEALLRGGADVALMLQWCILWEQHGVFDSASVAVNCWVIVVLCVESWDLESSYMPP